MNAAQKILRAVASRAMQAVASIGELDHLEAPKARWDFKSVGSPFGTHPKFGVLNRKTRRMMRSKKYARKLARGQG